MSDTLNGQPDVPKTANARSSKELHSSGHAHLCRHVSFLAHERPISRHLQRHAPGEIRHHAYAPLRNGLPPSAMERLSSG